MTTTFADMIVRSITSALPTYEHDRAFAGADLVAWAGLQDAEHPVATVVIEGEFMGTTVSVQAHDPRNGEVIWTSEFSAVAPVALIVQAARFAAEGQR